METVGGPPRRVRNYRFLICTLVTHFVSTSLARKARSQSLSLSLRFTRVAFNVQDTRKSCLPSK